MILYFDALLNTVQGTAKPIATTTVPTFKPTPGKCLTKDISPVEADKNWEDGCKDEDGRKYNYFNPINTAFIDILSGNLYVPGDSLVSCCGCFK